MTLKSIEHISELTSEELVLERIRMNKVVYGTAYNDVKEDDRQYLRTLEQEMADRYQKLIEKIELIYLRGGKIK